MVKTETLPAPVAPSSGVALLGSAPIPGGQATGIDLKYEPVYEDLQAALERASSVTSVGREDWEKVVALATEILASKSKDLTVAGYLAVGLIRTQKGEGFLSGTTVYLDLIEKYWDALFPSKERMRARERAIAWWVERAAATQKALAPNFAVTEEVRSALRTRLQSAQTFLEGVLEECPSFGPVIDALAPPPVVSPIEQTRATANADRSSSENSASSAGSTQEINTGDVVSQEDARRRLQQAGESIQRVATFLLTKDLADPEGFRLNRVALWLAVTELPPVEEGRTHIPPPDDALVTAMDDPQTRSTPDAAVRFAEESLSQSIFWFDLHRLSAQTLATMGSTHALSATAMGRELRLFLDRLPGIESLAFLDGKPFADAETLRWIQSLRDDAPAESARGERVSAESPITSAIDKIATALSKRNLTDALSHFDDAQRICTSGRDRLMLRIEFCRRLGGGHQQMIALAQAEQIVEELERYQLQSFDPALAVTALNACLQAVRNNDTTRAQTLRDDLLRRISKLDLKEFLRWSK